MLSRISAVFIKSFFWGNTHEAECASSPKQLKCVHLPSRQQIYTKELQFFLQSGMVSTTHLSVPMYPDSYLERLSIVFSEWDPMLGSLSKHTRLQEESKRLVSGKENLPTFSLLRTKTTVTDRKCQQKLKNAPAFSKYSKAKARRDFSKNASPVNERIKVSDHSQWCKLFEIFENPKRQVKELVVIQLSAAKRQAHTLRGQAKPYHSLSSPCYLLHKQSMLIV